LLVLYLEHPRVAAPTDGLRAGDDLARPAARARVPRERLAMNIHAGALTFAMKFDLAGSGT
jgi:hypothetical protein